MKRQSSLNLELSSQTMKQPTVGRSKNGRNQNKKPQQTIQLDDDNQLDPDPKSSKKIKLDNIPPFTNHDLECKIIQTQTAPKMRKKQSLAHTTSTANRFLNPILPLTPSPFRLPNQRPLLTLYSASQMHHEFHISSPINKPTVFAKFFNLQLQILLKANYNSFLIDQIALKQQLTKKAVGLYFKCSATFKFEVFKEWAQTHELFKGVAIDKRSYRLLVIEGLRTIIVKTLMFVQNDSAQDYFKVQKNKQTDKMLKHITCSHKWFQQRVFQIFSRLGKCIFLEQSGLEFRGEQLQYLYNQLQQIVNKNGCKKLAYISKLLRTAQTMSYKQYGGSDGKKWPNFYIPMRSLQWFAYEEGRVGLSGEFEVEVVKAFVRRGSVRATLKFVIEQMVNKKYDQQCLKLLKRDYLTQHLKSLLKRAIEFAQYQARTYFHQLFTAHQVQQAQRSLNTTNIQSKSSNHLTHDFAKFITLTPQQTTRLISDESEPACQRMLFDYYLSNAYQPKKHFDVKEMNEHKNLPFANHLIRGSSKLRYASEKLWKYPFEYLTLCVKAVLETVKWSECKLAYGYSMAPIQGPMDDHQNCTQVDYYALGIELWLNQHQTHYDSIFYKPVKERQPTQQQILQHNQQIIRDATEIPSNKNKRQKTQKPQKRSTINQFIQYFGQPKQPKPKSQKHTLHQTLICDADSTQDIVQVQCPQNDLRYLYNRVQRKEAEKQDLYRQLELSEREICRLNTQSQNEIFMREKPLNPAEKYGALYLDQDQKLTQKSTSRQRYKYNAINRKGKFVQTYQEFNRQNQAHFNSVRGITQAGKTQVKGQFTDPINAFSVDDDIDKFQTQLKTAKHDHSSYQPKALTIQLDAGRKIYPGLLQQGTFVKSQGHQKYLAARYKVFNSEFKQKPVPMQSAWGEELVDDRIQAFENKVLFK